jgi:hypothetical protein
MLRILFFPLSGSRVQGPPGLKITSNIHFLPFQGMGVASTSRAQVGAKL